MCIIVDVANNPFARQAISFFQCIFFGRKEEKNEPKKTLNTLFGFRIRFFFFVVFGLLCLLLICVVMGSTRHLLENAAHQLGVTVT